MPLLVNFLFQASFLRKLSLATSITHENRKHIEMKKQGTFSTMRNYESLCRHGQEEGVAKEVILKFEKKMLRKQFSIGD